MEVFGITAFADLSPVRLVALALIYFLSFTLKGMFGLGAMPPLVIFGSWVLGPHHAVVLAVVSNILSQIQFTPEALRKGDRRMVVGLVLAYLPATILGVWIFGTLESAWLTVVLGTTLIAIILLEGSTLSGRFDAMIRARAVVMGPVMAAISGVVGGVIGAGGVILVSTYIKMMVKDAEILRATILLVATFFITWRAAAYAFNGFVPISVLVECALLLPVILAGGYIGSKLFGLLPKDKFFPIFRVFLVLASLNLVVKGLQGVM